MRRKTNPDIARISLDQADRFYDIAQVQGSSSAAPADREANLRRAIYGYERALEFYTQARNPAIFGEAQNNLGNACRGLSRVRDKEKNLEKAIAAYREALKVRTLEAYPVQQYAMTQNNLGSAYRGFSEVRHKEENLGKAMAACAEALKVRTLDAFPVDYARTMFNIGLLQLQAGDLPKAERSLQDAEEVFRNQGMIDWAERAHKKLELVREQTDREKE